MKFSIVHRIISFLLILVLISSVLKSTSIIVGFIINQDLIAKTLCVQKEDQQGCNGKCQLAKAFKKNIKNNTESPIQNKENRIVLFNYIQPINNFVFTFYSKKEKKQFINGLSYKIINKYYETPTPPPLFS